MNRKRLVVCCDGTWNDADAGGEFTNVVRIARAIRPNDARTASEIPQIVYYHPGVGTGGDAVEHVVGGAIGLGLSRNVRDAYSFLADNYCDGDEVLLFGFSRGAYTARSVAGLIGWAGLLQKAEMDDFALLWEGYRLKDKPGYPDRRQAFPQRAAVVPIKCVGVWDTVGALGIPGHLGDLFTQFYQFHDTKLGPHVENAFHALAIDEHREDFVPTLWQRLPDAPAGQKLVQVWFAGAHSNVGGGYVEHGLSDVALAWMAGQVAPLLDLDRDYLASRQDRRDGWGLGKIYDSAAGLFGLRQKVNRPLLQGASEQLHASVKVRLDAGGYAPANLPGGPPAGRLAELVAVEAALRWPAPDPAQTGQNAMPKPSLLDRFLNAIGGG